MSALQMIPPNRREAPFDTILQGGISSQLA